MDSDGVSQCKMSGYTSLQVQQNQRYDQKKNRKESILKKAESILKYTYLIADIGAKSANRGSTSIGKLQKGFGPGPCRTLGLDYDIVYV